ncbi:hypothetical protein EJ377_14385 [Chryseobacterium arthrosphaerae]|uniref:Uncharacterized protein n=1 Tax=Chryseobacterium arthrosphaerae TaxID=651561 RepID=A0A432DRZ3_9FLAO|nr:hypothetical protein EJ377_14385 [Chryseobacterium arthrosphaerae]
MAVCHGEPENEKLWCKAEYQKIEILKSVTWLDAFCDENGKENTEKPAHTGLIFFGRKRHHDGQHHASA